MTPSASPASIRSSYKGLFLGAVAIFVATPLIATALGGLKSLGELRSNPFGLPAVWEWSNYADILFSKRYWHSSPTR